MISQGSVSRPVSSFSTSRLNCSFGISRALCNQVAQSNSCLSQRAWIGPIRIELQHLVVKLSRRRRHLGDAFEIADVLTGLFNDSGAVVLLEFLMSGDHRAWFQFLDCVECRDPLLAGPRV